MAHEIMGESKATDSRKIDYNKALKLYNNLQQKATKNNTIKQFDNLEI